ncbi:MAG: helix-turn-helix transcriptional regulator [Thalassobaculum sp.]|uniref:helix-turn-helix domain-containing protein n=1 Tax=Thalassobaculum sp. TaxID=2022740 RepID=UPI0032EC5565
MTTNNPVDQHVGRRVRERRLALGLSQSAIAQQIGVTGQQYQKYEKGENRISASRLFDLANCLRVPVSHFFDEMADETRVASPAHMLSSEPIAEFDAPITANSYERRQTHELLRLWQQLPDHARGRVVDLVRSMVDLSSESSGTAKADASELP